MIRSTGSLLSMAALIAGAAAQSWQPLAPTARATPLAYDVARARTVLFGGGIVFGPVYAETWEFDGSDWRLVPTVAAPSLRLDHALAHDVARGRPVLVGGLNGRPLGDR